MSDPPDTSKQRGGGLQRQLHSAAETLVKTSSDAYTDSSPQDLSSNLFREFTPFPFLRLPVEIQLMVYDILLCPTGTVIAFCCGSNRPDEASDYESDQEIMAQDTEDHTYGESVGDEAGLRGEKPSHFAKSIQIRSSFEFYWRFSPAKRNAIGRTAFENAVGTDGYISLTLLRTSKYVAKRATDVFCQNRFVFSDFSDACLWFSSKSLLISRAKSIEIDREVTAWLEATLGSPTMEIVYFDKLLEAASTGRLQNISISYSVVFEHLHPSLFEVEPVSQTPLFIEGYGSERKNGYKLFHDLCRQRAPRLKLCLIVPLDLGFYRTKYGNSLACLTELLDLKESYCAIRGQEIRDFFQHLHHYLNMDVFWGHHLIWSHGKEMTRISKMIHVNSTKPVVSCLHSSREANNGNVGDEDFSFDSETYLDLLFYGPVDETSHMIPVCRNPNGHYIVLGRFRGSNGVWGEEKEISRF